MLDTPLLYAAAVAVVFYAAAVLALVVAGRGAQARALARFVPDCAVLFARLMREPGLPRRRKAILAAVALYLASPIDLVPDFVPVAGLADDALVVAVALRWLVRSCGTAPLAQLWPGPEASLRLVIRLAGAPAPSPPRG